MCPPVVDHTVTILVLKAQHCYHGASIMQRRGWEDDLYPQFPYDCHFFLSVQMGLLFHLHQMQKIISIMSSPL
jgi:hypothetical protein